MAIYDMGYYAKRSHGSKNVVVTAQFFNLPTPAFSAGTFKCPPLVQGSPVAGGMLAIDDILPVVGGQWRAPLRDSPTTDGLLVPTTGRHSCSSVGTSLVFVWCTGIVDLCC